MVNTYFYLFQIIFSSHNLKSKASHIDIGKNLTKTQLCAAVPGQSSFIIFAWSMGKCVNKPFNSRIFFPSFQFDRFFLGLLIFFCIRKIIRDGLLHHALYKKRYVLKSVVALVIEFCQFNSVLTNICYIAL